jgi:hypothetical protein
MILSPQIYLNLVVKGYQYTKGYWYRLGYLILYGKKVYQF